MREVRFELMRPDEIVEEKKRLPLVFLPVGPLEWHGPHLPLGTDPLIAYEIAIRLAREIGGVVLPPFYWGTERERDANTLKSLGFREDEWIIGMDFPANSMKSLYILEEFFSLGIRVFLEKLVEQGYKFIVIVNGHGAANQILTLERLAKEFQNEKNVVVMVEFVAVPDENGAIDYGHAVASETSKLMAIYPEKVDLGKLPPKDRKYRYRDFGIVDSDGFFGHPSPNFEVQEKDDPRFSASPETGEKLLQRSFQVIAERVKQRVSQK